MREDIKNLDELSDSRELLEARPNPIIAWFIYLLIVIFVSAIIWTYFGEVDEVVKADGVVRANEAVSTIRNETPRHVKRIAFSEGQQVEADDILIELDSTAEELQKEQLEAALVEKEEELADARLFKRSIEKGESQFKEESEYYQRYQAYQSNRSLIKQEHESAKLEISENRASQNSQKSSIQSQKESLKSKSRQLKRLRDAINNKKNVFKKEETPYYHRYKDINVTMGQLEKSVAETKEAYETVKNSNSGAPGQTQLNEVKKIYEEAIVKRDQYKNQQLMQVNSEIDQAEDRLKEVEAASGSDIDFAKIEESYDKNYQASIEKHKTESLVEITNEIKEAGQQIDQLKHELAVVEQQIETNTVRAPKSGIVNVRTDISEGDLLQAGTEILTIIPETDPSAFTVQLSVLNHDIAKTDVGDKVKFSIHSLPSEEYGKVTGEITQVSSDATIDAETGISYYLVEATIDNEALYSHKGNEEAIKIGMTTEAHIVADSKKILYLLLEKMHLRD